MTLALAAATIAVHLVPDAVEYLQYDRSALAAGEWWRWCTGHFTHFDLNHLIWDVVVFIVLGTWSEWQSRARTIAAVFLASLVIPAAIATWQPHFTVYRGLSGLDCALFGVVAGMLLKRSEIIPRCVGAMALLAFAAKCVVEIATDSTVFATGDGYSPVPLAHLVGLIAGLAPTFSGRVPHQQPTSLNGVTCCRQKPC